jgi:hypothetical protein
MAIERDTVTCEVQDDLRLVCKRPGKRGDGRLPLHTSDVLDVRHLEPG